MAVAQISGRRQIHQAEHRKVAVDRIHKGSRRLHHDWHSTAGPDDILEAGDKEEIGFEADNCVACAGSRLFGDSLGMIC